MKSPRGTSIQSPARRRGAIPASAALFVRPGSPPCHIAGGVIVASFLHLPRAEKLTPAIEYPP